MVNWARFAGRTGSEHQFGVRTYERFNGQMNKEYFVAPQLL